MTPTGSVRVEVEQTEPGPLFRLREVLGGTVQLRGTRNVWRWRLTRRAEVVDCISLLESSSWGRKRDEAAVALSLLQKKLTPEAARRQIHNIRERSRHE